MGWRVTKDPRTRRLQRGQAMVLNAMTLIILFGMIGLAIDGGRLYWERRTLQNAVDAAALAASDNYQDSFFGTAQSAPGSAVNLSPGIYSTTLSGSSGCYFLAPGIYTLNAGYGTNKGLISNYLRPPDEPAWNSAGGAPDYTTVTTTPLWSGCAGSFAVTGYADGLSLGVGSWGAVVTATRTDALARSCPPRRTSPRPATSPLAALTAWAARRPPD